MFLGLGGEVTRVCDGWVGWRARARDCVESRERESCKGENLGFCVKVPSGGSLHAASGNAEGGVLKSL